MTNRNLLLGWIWALQLILTSADDITNWEQIITVASIQFSYPLDSKMPSICHLRLRFDLYEVMLTRKRRRQKRIV